MTTVTDRASRFEMGRVVSNTFGALGRNIVTFLVLAVAIVAIPVFILSWLNLQISPVRYAAVSGAIPASGVAGASALGFAIILAKWALSSILIGAVVQGVVSDLNGTRPTLGESFAVGLRLILPVAAVGFLFGVGVVLGFVLLVVPGFIFLTMWCVAIPVVVLEKPGVFAAFSRSGALTKGHRWALFGLLFLFWLVVAIFNLTILALFGALPWINPDFATRMTGVLPLFITSLVGVASNLVGTAGIASIYYELRSIKDGATPATLAAVFD